MDAFKSLLNNPREFIFDTVSDALAQYFTPKQNQSSKNEEDQYFTVEELHEYLPGNPPIATIYSWSSKGLIPKTNLGRRVVFRKSRIDAWIAAKDNPTNAEIGSIPIPTKKRK